MIIVDGIILVVYYELYLDKTPMSNVIMTQLWIICTLHDCTVFGAWFNQTLTLHIYTFI